MPKMTLFAAISIGSSRLSMKIFQLEKSGAISTVESCESNVSIGKETFNNGKLSYELTEEICICLDKFKRIMKEYGVTEYLCYATSGVREASNSEYIRDQILIRTGFKVGIASDEEERFLHHKALALNMNDFDSIIEEGAVIVDVSSGSLQVSSYEKSELKFSQNLPLGSIRITEQLSELKNNTVEYSKLLKEYISNRLEIYGKIFFNNPVYKYVIMVGSQADNIKYALGLSGDEVEYSQIENLYSELEDKGIYDFSDKYNISYEESRQIMVSLLLYMPFIKKKKLLMPGVEFTDGICVEYAEKNKFTHTRHLFTNDILSSAKYYAGKYNVNMLHADKTAEYCTEIFNALSKKFGLSKFDLVLLKVAAIYAETGMFVNINDYNVYSYNIKKSNKLLGLSKRDNDIISYILLFQNGVFENDEFRYLSKSRKLQISKLASILCLAQSLDFEHKQKIENIRVSLKGAEMSITASAYTDITMEKWRFDESASFFKEVFGIQAKLKVRNI